MGGLQEGCLRFRCAVCFSVALGFAQGIASAQTLYPNKDGTLADGGIYGPFDGFADDADWYFNNSSYEGSIALATGGPGADLEHRIVCEFRLNTITRTPPVGATLSLQIRGVRIYPFPDVDVHVYSYPADLVEKLDDFHMGPAEFMGVATVVAYQPATVYTVDVSDAVSEALASGNDMVAFRIQIDPDTPHAMNQAFLDSIDAEPFSKPTLTVTAPPRIPGDFDYDGDVDEVDYLSFMGCMTGPGVYSTLECRLFDFNGDWDVDMLDFVSFLAYFTGA